MQLHNKPLKQRLPINAVVVILILCNSAMNAGHNSNSMIWAACSLAFFGFLRCGEFTIPSDSDFDPQAHLTIDDIAIDNHITPSTICVRIKQSKTDPFREGVYLFLGKTDKVICPIKGILPYLAIRGSTPGPFFVMENKKSLTRQRFYSSLAGILEQSGLSHKNYNTHSFRIGAATTARQAGIPDAQIQMLGRWQSNAYKQYIKTPCEELARLSKQLISNGNRTDSTSS